MWLTQGVVDIVKNEYKVKEKLFDQDGVAVLDSGFFGKILVEDDVALYCEHDSAMRHEVLAHTAMCSHEEPRKVLVIDGGDGAVAAELLKHKRVSIDVVERDSDIVDAAKIFGCYDRALEDERVTFKTEDPLAFLAEAKEGTYDIVIFNRFDEIYLDDAAVMAQTNRVLTQKGLVVMDASSQLFDMAGHKSVLAALGREFKIVMPFRYTSMVRTGGEQWFALGSKFFHPTADINLQRADLTDGFTWYNSDLHIAQFALSTGTFELLKEYIKR
ncbi:spermidine synthase [Hydrogenimonas urashimensis]|uniref:spermine/spermidine synthase domain-containing protein n=1 Tax=Hydrogenimonas urashimensis TaxID=2740515 RepID=UPI00191526C4|nr:spermidine synthase [Hydrogenimonas urashimensis]